MNTGAARSIDVLYVDTSDVIAYDLATNIPIYEIESLFMNRFP